MKKIYIDYLEIGIFNIKHNISEKPTKRYLLIIIIVVGIINYLFRNKLTNVTRIITNHSIIYFQKKLHTRSHEKKLKLVDYDEKYYVPIIGKILKLHMGVTKKYIHLRKYLNIAQFFLWRITKPYLEGCWAFTFNSQILQYKRIT